MMTDEPFLTICMPFAFLTNPVKNLLPFLLVDLALEPVNTLLCFSRGVVIEKEFQHSNGGHDSLSELNNFS